MLWESISSSSISKFIVPENSLFAQVLHKKNFSVKVLSSIVFSLKFQFRFCSIICFHFYFNPTHRWRDRQAWPHLPIYVLIICQYQFQDWFVMHACGRYKIGILFKILHK